MATDSADKEFDKAIAEVYFDRSVKSLLTQGLSHKDLQSRLSLLTKQAGENLPPQKVLYCDSYGGFMFSPDFERFLAAQPEYNSRCSRSDPVLINAISDYGRSVCDSTPHLLNAFRTTVKWNIKELLWIIPQRRGNEREAEFDPDLVARAKAAIQPINKGASGHHEDALFEVDRLPYPLKLALRFAHTLLLTNKHPKYFFEEDEARDSVIYERLGLYFASTRSSQLEIAEVPALVHYDIDEHNGLEVVRQT